MDIGEIIGDAIAYPLRNVKALLIYMLIGIIGGVLGGASIVGMLATVAGAGNVAVAGGLGIIGLVIFVITALLVSGYGLDIVKFGIERREDGPSVDFGRQVSNAIKLLIVYIVYYIIPAIIIGLLMVLLGSGILTLIIALIVAIVFTFAEFMAICRLAKYDSLGEALAIGEAIADISKVGMVKVLLTVIIVVLIAIVMAFIIALIMGLNEIIGEILLGIFIVYLTFFYNRAMGLLYSDV